MIAVIDYGMGNLRSVSKALEHLGAEARVTSDPQEIARATKLVLPGVGAFGAAMQELTRRGLVEPIRQAITRGVPYLGICLGLQLLFDESEEGGKIKGLGLLRGRVRRLQAPSLKIPHMGWNQVTSPTSTAGCGQMKGCPLLHGIPEESYVYFVHSYYADPADRSIVALEADYGGRFTAMVWRRSLFATQFHPEKSQAVGLRLLQNFIGLS